MIFQIIAILDVDALRQRLGEKRKAAKAAGEGRSQEEVNEWEQFKQTAFARTIATAYIVAMLASLVRVHVAVASRHAQYAAQQKKAADAAAASLNSNNPFALPPPTKEQKAESKEEDDKEASAVNTAYLEMIEHCQAEGLVAFLQRLRPIVDEELGKWKLTQRVLFADIEGIVENIRTQLQRY